MSFSCTRSRPRVLIIGGEDVDARLDLMKGLAADYAPAAAGTETGLAPSFARCGFPYFHYPLWRGLAPHNDLRALLQLYRVLLSYRPHVVHAFDTKPGIYGCLAARLAGVPAVIGTITGLGSLYEKNGGKARLIRSVYEVLQRFVAHQSDCTVFQNRQDLAEFQKRRVVPAQRAMLIPGSGVATERLDPARFCEEERRQTRDSLGVPAGCLLVTMIARLIRSKGVSEYVAAAEQVRQRLPGAHFVLVGPDDRASVDCYKPEEVAELARIVHWVGPRRDIPRILAASNLCVLPSYLREGIPRVLLEAASMGLPIITTDSPGCNEVVEDGVNGILVPARDSAALCRAILRLLDQPELWRRYGAESRRRAIERFDLSVIIRQTSALYRELLATPALRGAPEGMLTHA
jgi:glycosyltransferase involved in cell wall biosynthesis